MAKYPDQKNIVGLVDPFCPDNFNKPLWCVCGDECFPTIFGCKIAKDYCGEASIWGLSIYRRSAGYRTIGRHLKKWINEERNHICFFFDSHEAAIEYVRQLTTDKDVKR